jgi:orotidine-5'-phosphate decarboxylase
MNRSSSPSPARLRAAKKRLIFPLDVASHKEATEYVDLLSDEVGLFKVGKQLFMHAGPEIVRSIQKTGGQVFLDLKFHDIPQTVANAGIEAARLGVAMFNLHASGGLEMMRKTRTEVYKVCRTEHLRRPIILGVTVLTSLSRHDLQQTGVAAGVEKQVLRLAKLAQEAGLHGVVTSPQEVARLRHECGPGLQLVVPGIRPPDAAWDDQKRVLTPQQAMQGGADYLVVGRPIRDAPDPRVTAQQIVRDMAQGLADATHKNI